MVTFRESGVKGHDGQNGKSGSSGKNGANGTSGSNGTDGQNGQDADDCQVILASNSNNELTVNNGATGKVIGTSDCFLDIYVDGGLGGSGGEGGSGGSGGDGIPGQDARQGVKGTNGGNGGDGGNGGHGGNGGKGGNGGRLTICCSQKDTDLLYLINNVFVNGGSGGRGGRGGAPGHYGNSGRAGKSFTGFDGVKNQNGGQSGNSGKGGSRGNNGKDGADGKDGSYYYQIIETQAKYLQIFNLVMGNLKAITSPDQIIEPGEKFKINVVLKNGTAMSTPTGSPITVSLVENSLILQNSQQNICIYSEAIAGGQEVTLPKDFEFRIAPRLEPSINSPLNECYKLKFKAILNRVKAEFKGVSNYEQIVKIEYPVELTFISAPRSFIDDEEFPIVIGIKNKSSLPLGSKNGRLVNLRFYNEGNKGAIKFTPYSEEDSKIMESNNSDANAKKALDKSNYVVQTDKYNNFELIKQMFIPNIQPGETLFFRGSAKVVDPKIQAYDCANLTFCLDIGHIDEPTTKYQTIQENTLKLQKSEQFSYKDTSDVLLIINTEIERDSIQKIRESFKIFGTTCDIYSIAQLKEFSYQYDPNNKTQSPLANKAVVIFGNTFHDDKNKLTNAVKIIGLGNIFKSAYQDNTRNYIMGSSKHINYGRIFNYSAIELYRGSKGHEMRETFPYNDNFKIMIPDLAFTYLQFTQKFRQLNPEEDQGVSLLDETQKNILEDNKKADKNINIQQNELKEYEGVEQECNLLFSGQLQQSMKNLEEVANYFKQNPHLIQSVENLETSHRLKLEPGVELDDNYDNKGVIMKQVASAHAALSKFDPAYQYHTRHYYNNSDHAEPNILELYIGKAYKDCGNMYVTRGLRKDCSQICFRDKGEVAPTVDDGDIYNILKIIPVAKKVGYINKFTGQNETLADILFASIASDLCDEFKAFSSGFMRSGWKAPQYLEAMEGWQTINQFNFDPLVQSKNVFLLKKFLVMLECVITAVSDQVGFFIKLCACSCLSIASSIVLTVCKNVQKTVVPKINACQGASDQVSNLVSKKFEKSNNSQLKLDAIARPDRLLSKGSTFYSNQSTCIAQAFDPLPTWIRQELQQMENAPKKAIKIDVSTSKKVYTSDKQRKDDINKYTSEINKKQS